MESQGVVKLQVKSKKNENNLKKKKTRGNMYTMLINTNQYQRKKNCTFFITQLLFTNIQLICQ